MSLNRRLNGGVDVLEDVALCKDVAARPDLEGMAGRVVPVVVDLISVSAGPIQGKVKVDEQHEEGCSPGPWDCDR